MLRLLATSTILAALLIGSCGTPKNVPGAELNEESSIFDDLEAAYRSPLNANVLLFRDDEMYGGFLPVWEKDDGVRKAFVPIVRSKTDVEGGECLHAASPMDEYPGAIAIAKPPSAEFTGTLNCGNFRIEVQPCEAFDRRCSTSYLKVFNMTAERYVSFQLWDKCRGVYLIADFDLVSNPESWKSAFYSVKEDSLFGATSSECLSQSSYE